MYSLTFCVRIMLP